MESVVVEPPSHGRCSIRGSINKDEYFYVRSIARPGETISSHHYTCRVGGKGVNQAVAITRAGGTADFYGIIGNDGLSLKESVTKFGLDSNGIVVSDMPTGRALIQIADSGENSIILFPGANHDDRHEQMWTASSFFPETSHLLLQNEIRWDSTLFALNSVKLATVIFNPSPVPSEEHIRTFPWEKVDWLIVNEGEARDLYLALQQGEVGIKITSNHELIAALSNLPSFATMNIICTLGKDGVLTFMPFFHRSNVHHSCLHVPAVELQGTVRDTTGAGDCFTGYFVQGLMEYGPHAKIGKEIQEADIIQILRISVQAAGMCVERPGTLDGIPTRTEVEARMNT